MLLDRESSPSGKRKRRSRADRGLSFCATRSYSSIMFSTSSSVVTVINASKSSFGSWYFAVMLLVPAQSNLLKEIIETKKTEEKKSEDFY